MIVDDHIRNTEKSLVSCSPENAVQAVAVTMSANHIGAVPVVTERGHLVGIVSERDILRCLARRGERVSWMSVADIMTKKVITCSRDTKMSDAQKLMLEHHIRHIVVTDGRRVIGILSMRDAVKAQMEQATMEAKVLRDDVIANRIH